MEYSFLFFLYFYLERKLCNQHFFSLNKTERNRKKFGNFQKLLTQKSRCLSRYDRSLYICCVFQWDLNGNRCIWCCVQRSQGSFVGRKTFKNIKQSLPFHHPHGSTPSPGRLILTLKSSVSMRLLGTFTELISRAGLPSLTVASLELGVTNSMTGWVVPSSWLSTWWRRHVDTEC